MKAVRTAYSPANFCQIELASTAEWKGTLVLLTPLRGVVRWCSGLLREGHLSGTHAAGQQGAYAYVSSGAGHLLLCTICSLRTTAGLLVAQVLPQSEGVQRASSAAGWGVGRQYWAAYASGLC
jgi:hypothetical protein